MNIVVHDEKTGFAMIEINNSFYVVEIDGNQFKTAIPSDRPSKGGEWFANYGRCEAAVKYVANPRTRATARRWFTKLVKERKSYMI